jgi:hypothetical protein
LNTVALKSIGAYSLAIGGAIGFFHLVTSYGEAHLQAPPAVVGVYAIASTQELPICLQSKQLALDLQQSGVYLNANLIDNSSDRPQPSRPSLSGRLHDRQLQLAGLAAPICPQWSKIQISGTIAPDRRLQGRLTLAPESPGTPTPSKSIAFTATPTITPKAVTTAH